MTFSGSAFAGFSEGGVFLPAPLAPVAGSVELTIDVEVELRSTEVVLSTDVTVLLSREEHGGRPEAVAVWFALLW